METAPVQASPGQAALGELRNALQDRLVSPEELQTLQAAVQNTDLPDSDKQILGQVVSRIAGFNQSQGSQYLSAVQMQSVKALLATMASPEAQGFAQELDRINQIPQAPPVNPPEAPPTEPPPTETPESDPSQPPATGVVYSGGTSESSEKKGFFGAILDAIINFFGAIFDFIGSIFGAIGGALGIGDENKTRSHPQASFSPNAFTAPETAPSSETSAPPPNESYLRDYARPDIPDESANFDQSLPQNQTAGSMYQRSQFHDDNKFVPSFGMAAFHESGSYRDANDPYAVGAISRPRQASDDLGGKTYGTYQFESSVQLDGTSQNNGQGSTLDRFINDPQNRFGAQLKAVAQEHGLASPQFDQVWMQLANEHNKEFGIAQEEFMRRDKQATVQTFTNRAGLSDAVLQDPRIVDLIIGTCNHVGDLALQAAEHLASRQTQLGRALTADEAGRELIAFKESKIASWFESSPGAHQGILNRFRAEARQFAAASS